MPVQRRYDVFGHPCTLVVRWMGAQGWSADEAFRTLRDMGCPVAASTVQAYINDIRNGRGPMAVVTQEQAERLADARRGLGPRPFIPLQPTPSPRPEMRQTPRQRRVQVAASEHACLRVEQRGSDYTLTVTHHDAKLANKLIRLLNRVLTAHDTANVYGGLTSSDPLLADLIAQAKLSPAARFDAEGGIISEI